MPLCSPLSCPQCHYSPGSLEELEAGQPKRVLLALHDLQRQEVRYRKGWITPLIHPLCGRRVLVLMKNIEKLNEKDRKRLRKLRRQGRCPKKLWRHSARRQYKHYPKSGRVTAQKCIYYSNSVGRVSALWIQEREKLSPEHAAKVLKKHPMLPTKQEDLGPYIKQAGLN